MNVFVSGLNFKTTPLEIREKLSFHPEEQKEALARIRGLPGVNGCVLLSTCNRTEVYVHFEEDGFDSAETEKTLCEVKGLRLYDLKKHFYAYRGEKAARHLFKVACGLDSMILCEDQILGQVKAAHITAMEEGTASGVLNTLFRNAVAAAKKIKAGDGPWKNSVSVGSAAVRHMLELCGEAADGLSALVIGTGKIGSIVVRSLCAEGVGRIYITNRSHGRSEDLAKHSARVRPVGYCRRYSVMDECDLVVSATSSPHYTITRDMLEASLKTRKQRIFCDLAVPRDMDESIGKVDGVTYFDMDQLAPEGKDDTDRRSAEAGKAEKAMDRFVMEFENWYEFRKALPVVKDVQKFIRAMAEEKLEATLDRLKCASEEDKETVRISVAGIVNRIMDRFVYGIRENGSKEDIRAYFAYLEELVREKD